MSWHGARPLAWTLVEIERFRLDAATMFSMLPRTRWEKFVATDDLGRMTLSNYSLVVRCGKQCVVIEAGWGDKLDAGEREHYAVEEIGGGLTGCLGKLGITPEAVTDVVVTHLHIDHAGGLTRADGAEAAPTFPRATCHVQKAEWLAAHRMHPLTKGSYKSCDFDPIADAGLLRLWDTDGRVAPGVQLVPTGGHTRGHQSVLVGAGADAILYAGDILPTGDHVRPAFVTSYDTEPLVTVRAKQHLLGRAAAHGWRVVLFHDPEMPVASVDIDARGHFKLTPSGDAR